MKEKEKINYLKGTLERWAIFLLFLVSAGTWIGSFMGMLVFVCYIFLEHIPIEFIILLPVFMISLPISHITMNRILERASRDAGWERWVKEEGDGT